MKKIILLNKNAPISYDFNKSDPADLNFMLREKISDGLVHFSFKKKDGTIREAFGTINPDLFKKITGNEINANNGESSTQNPAIGVYFDIESTGWRSYIIENIIAIY